MDTTYTLERRVSSTTNGAGGGTVSLLVLGRQVPLAREVVERGAAGLPVHAVPAGGA